MNDILGYYSRDQIDNIYGKVRSFLVGKKELLSDLPVLAALKLKVDEYFNSIISLEPVREEKQITDGLIQYLDKWSNDKNAVILYNKIYNIARREYDDLMPVSATISLCDMILSCQEYKDVIKCHPNMENWDDQWFTEFANLYI